MAQFILKVDDKEIPLDSITPSDLRDVFLNLTTRISRQIESITCDVHRLEPLFILRSNNSKVTLAGLGTCCKEFGSKVETLIDGIEGLKDPNLTIARRELRYTHQE